MEFKVRNENMSIHPWEMWDAALERIDQLEMALHLIGKAIAEMDDGDSCPLHQIPRDDCVADCEKCVTEWAIAKAKLVQNPAPPRER